MEENILSQSKIESIIKGSILIVEFLGSKLVNNDPINYPNGYYYQPSNIENDCPTGEPQDWNFHTSWDWLIPVYKKIKDTIDIANEKSIHDNHILMKYNLLQLDIIHAIYEANIEKTFYETVKFIEYWNSSK